MTRARFIGWLGAVAAAVCLAEWAPGVEPQPQAHAHNDYEHDRPLFDALSHGFCSVEADIYEIDGELLVAHDRPDVRPDRTLQRLYLDPLWKRVQENGGRVYKNGPAFTLLIDFKSDGESTYRVLRQVLTNYREMLVAPGDEKHKTAAVTIVISGNRPFALIESDTDRLVGVDGRLKDLESDLSADFMPMISDNWTHHFQWRGDGEFPEVERSRLVSSVREAHAAGRRIRFWATPENEAVWRELKTAGVDHINTDQLEKLEAFLAK